MMDALIDIDFGILITIRDKFPNNKLIEYDIFKHTDNQIKYLLLNRIHENPLCLVMWKYNDNLYNEIYDIYREDIYKNSIFTNIVNMLITTTKLDNIKITILCKDVKDKHFIETQHADVMGSYKALLLDEVSFNQSDFIFINKPGSILDRDDIHGTNVYLFKSMYNLGYNKEEEVYQMRPHIADVENIAVVKFLSPYLMDDSYIIKGDD